MTMPPRDPSCPCTDGCPMPDCQWDGLSCACPAHGSAASGSKPGFEGSCDECAWCKAARDPEL